VVVVLIAGGTAAYLLTRPSHRSSASDPASSPAAKCSSGVALTVVAAESIAPAISNIANAWVATHPVIDGACPRVNVHVATSSAEEATLTKPDVSLPDIWIPDSSLWIQRLGTDIEGQDTDAQSLWLYPSIASSPLVLATTESNVAAVTSAAKAGWASALATGGATMLDPTSSTEGLLTLLTAQSLLSGTSTTPSRGYVNAMVGLAHSTVADSDAGFLALSAHPAAQMAFPASEQEVITANTNGGQGPHATAVYPSGKSLSLDYPIAEFAPAGGNPAQRDSATQFAAVLSAASAQKQLRAIGLRDAAGHPLTAAATANETSTSSATTPAATPAESNLPEPTAAQVADGLRVWDAADRETRTLLVIDTSGSMADDIGGGQSKIQFAAAAEKAALNFFPDQSSLGLWTFSATSNPQDDWTEIVPVGKLGETVGNQTRRQALAAAAATLPGRVGGNTGLYNTVLAAFEAVRTGYDSTEANSVVLLTDGSNTQTAGVNLATLLSTLRSQTSATAPLPIITIAVGSDADIATLKQISAATGGSTLTAAQPEDIQDAVLDALVNAGS
jgi:hypothetical protein